MYMYEELMYMCMCICICEEELMNATLACMPHTRMPHTRMPHTRMPHTRIPMRRDVRATRSRATWAACKVGCAFDPSRLRTRYIYHTHIHTQSGLRVRSSRLRKQAGMYVT